MIDWETHNVLIVAVSDKHKNDDNGGYCVAGFDITDNNLANGNKLKWIRLIGNRENEYYKLINDEVIYESGEICKPLDVVKVKAKKMTEIPESFLYEQYKNYNKESMLNVQPENYVVFGKFEFVYKITLKQLLENVPLENQEFIFGNDYKCLSAEEAIKNNKSLTIARVEDLKLYPKKNYWSYQPKYNIHYRACFKYNGKYYDDISVTDPYYVVNPEDENPKELHFSNDVYLVISLGERYMNNHYKIIAKIFIDELV